VTEEIHVLLQSRIERNYWNFVTDRQNLKKRYGVWLISMPLWSNFAQSLDRIIKDMSR